MNAQYKDMLEIVSKMDSYSRLQVSECLYELEQTVKRYGSISVIALAVMSAKAIDKGEQHGKD